MMQHQILKTNNKIIVWQSVGKLRVGSVIYCVWDARGATYAQASRFVQIKETIVLFVNKNVWS